MIEKPQRKLDPKYRADCPIQIRLGKRALVDAIYESLLKNAVLEIVELHIDARADRHTCGVLWCRCNVMDIVEAANRAKIGKHKSLKAPFIAQNLLQKERIRRDRDAVNLVIRGHCAHRMSFAKGRLKSSQHDHAQFALSHMHGRGVRAAFGRTMPRRSASARRLPSDPS